MGEGTFTGKKSGESLLRREARMPWAQDALERRTHKSRAEACCAWMREWRGAQDALERPTYSSAVGRTLVRHLLFATFPDHVANRAGLDQARAARGQLERQFRRPHVVDDPAPRAAPQLRGTL